MDNNISPAAVNDRNTFIKFVQELKKDFETNKSSWENADLGSFLEALASYTEDIQGYYDNMNIKADADCPSWRIFADILKGVSMYE